MIELKNVNYIVKEQPILVNISLNVNRGEVVCLMGPSGSGKSTLLKIISGLLRPSSGEVYINGVPLSGTLKNCFYNFQTYDSFPWLTVRENLKAHNVLEDDNICDHFLELLGLAEHRNKYPKEISTGMRKRLSLGRCFVSKPEVILLDESFSSLDTKTQLDMYALLLKQKKLINSTIILITHQIEEAVTLSDRILLSKKTPFTVEYDFQNLNTLGKNDVEIYDKLKQLIMAD